MNPVYALQPSLICDIFAVLSRNQIVVMVAI
jgi:hypothetical protein